MRRSPTQRVRTNEPGLEELIHKNEKAGRLRFTTNLAKAIERGGLAPKKTKSLYAARSSRPSLPLR